MFHSDGVLTVSMLTTFTPSVHLWVWLGLCECLVLTDPGLSQIMEDQRLYSILKVKLSIITYCFLDLWLSDCFVLPPVCQLLEKTELYS